MELLACVTVINHCGTNHNRYTLRLVILPVQYADLLMNSGHKPKTRSVWPSLLDFIGHLAYIAVLPAERQSLGAACYRYAIVCSELDCDIYRATACNATHGVAKAFLSVSLSGHLSVKRMHCGKTKESCKTKSRPKSGYLYSALLWEAPLRRSDMGRV